jgi:hypothetical protein
MRDRPSNPVWWFVLAAVSLAGGLIYHQVHGSTWWVLGPAAIFLVYGVGHAVGRRHPAPPDRAVRAR